MPGTQEMTDRVRDRLVERLGLTEVGDPYEHLGRVSDGSPVGHVRVWTGDRVACLVDSRLTVPDLGIDSTMLHAFTRAGSTSPHLVSDLAGLPHGVNFHVDLVPRVDLASQPGYLDTVYPPLTDARAAAYAVAEASVNIPLRLIAFASPWLVGVTVTPERLSEMEQTYLDYVDHFAELVEKTPAVDGAPDVAARDAVTRRAQFDAATDPVWDMLANLVGRASVDRLLALLHSGVPATA
jgi:hypothetical protein